MQQFIRWFKDIGMHNIDQVGGKNASLGEMFNHLNKLGIKVPDGFATTAQAYRDFLQQNNLEKKINDLLLTLNVDDISALSNAGQQIREWIIHEPFNDKFAAEIVTAYEQLMKSNDVSSLAVRSSATAEDLADASFAGQQETFLNVSGKENVLLAVKKVFASLFNDRAIAYRVHKGFEHTHVALSAGIQRMVRSDLATSGVMFTLDTESGFNDVVLITAAYGLGETIVQGSVNPDEFYVHKLTLAAKKPAILRRNLGTKVSKMIYDISFSSHSVSTVPVEETKQQIFCLTDEEIMHLAQQAVLIEEHYQRPMDIEWAKDGIDGQLYIVQARPETVKSQHQQTQIVERYQLAKQGEIIVTGRSIGQRIGKGTAKVLRNIQEMGNIQPGDVLVTDMTDPDWEPIMKRASAIVTNRGGRTCHAAIIARELGIPAVVGCNDATQKIVHGSDITVSCAEGDTGYIYKGLLPFDINRMQLNHLPELPFKIMLNVGDPDHAFTFQHLPNAGVGLARLEFIINSMIGIHPKALLEYETLPADLQAHIAPRIRAYANPIEYYVERLKEGIATIAAAFYPKPVIVRLSDFKSNEYANLLGGKYYEQPEENPMIGFRGASRYVSPLFRDCFELECKALKRVRDDMGLTNVEIMLPFVRTLNEAKQVTVLLAEHGLSRGNNDLRLIMMCEIPSNALLAEQFLEYFDGFSIGSNDLTQLTLGLDRDSATIAELFDERDPAVKVLFQQAIRACKKTGKYIGICGQGPSDHPDLAQWLMEQGIDSVSLNPDSVLNTWLFLGRR